MSERISPVFINNKREPLKIGTEAAREQFARSRQNLARLDSLITSSSPLDLPQARNPKE